MAHSSSATEWGFRLKSAGTPNPLLKVLSPTKIVREGFLEVVGLTTRPQRTLSPRCIPHSCFRTKSGPDSLRGVLPSTPWPGPGSLPVLGGGRGGRRRPPEGRPSLPAAVRSPRSVTGWPSVSHPGARVPTLPPAWPSSVLLSARRLPGAQDGLMPSWSHSQMSSAPPPAALLSPLLPPESRSPRWRPLLEPGFAHRLRPPVLLLTGSRRCHRTEPVGLGGQGLRGDPLCSFDRQAAVGTGLGGFRVREPVERGGEH